MAQLVIHVTSHMFLIKGGVNIKTDILEATKKFRVTAILRGIENDRIRMVIDALYEGGIRLLEITYDQKSPTKIEDTTAAIRYAVEKYGSDMYVGAGTVMSAEEVLAAKKAGAQFILSPNVDPDVIRIAVSEGLCAIPGAMTPSEAAEAYKAGAQIIKLFPAGDLGLDYYRSIKAPLSHIPMIAVGGVNEKNLADFLIAGFIGAGIGSNLTRKELINNRDFDGLRRLAEIYMKAAVV